MAEARITEFLGETQTDGRSVRIREKVLDFMGLGSCMPREAWRLPSPQPLQDVLSGVGVDLVEVVVVVVVVVGVVRRHLLDAGGDAPHWLHVRLRGRPAPRPPLFDPPSPPGSHAPSRLSLGARGALALALGPPSGPLPVPWGQPPVTHALACLLAHCPSLRPMPLGALPEPPRALPVPWPLPGSLP